MGVISADLRQLVTAGGFCGTPLRLPPIQQNDWRMTGVGRWLGKGGRSGQSRFSRDPVGLQICVG